MARRPRGGAALVCIALHMFAAALATASAGAEQVGRARLSLARSEGAKGCVDEATLAARIGQHLTTSWQGESDVLLDVLIDGEVGRLSARVTASGARRGVRRLDSESCEGLVDALSVSIALLLDDDASAPLPPPAPSPSAPPALPPPAPPPRAPPADEAHRFAVALGGGAGFGLPRSVSPLLFAGFDARLSRSFTVGASLLHAPSQSLAVAPGEVSLWLLLGSVDACVRAAHRGRLEAFGCGTLVGGALRGEGRGFAPDRAATRPWVGAGLGVEGRAMLLESVGVKARVEGLAPLGGDETFSVEPDKVVYDRPPASLSALLAVTMHFR